MPLNTDVVDAPSAAGQLRDEIPELADLRHTFGRLYMAAPKSELSKLHRIMGHASAETTSAYVRHDDHELAASVAGSSGCSADPLARREERRREPAAGTAA
jgi:hypothetical protein